MNGLASGERTRAMFLLGATALIWSSGGLAIKAVDLPPMAMTGVRSALSALTLAALFRGRLDLSFTPARICAAFSYAAMLITNVAATKMTTAANAILLAYTAPVYVALLAPRLLGEKTRLADWLFVGVTLTGMALFFLDKMSAQGLWGNLVAVGTGVSYAAFTLSMRAQALQNKANASPVEGVLWGHALTALIGLPFLLPELSQGRPDLAGWAGLAYLGVIQQGLSLALYVWCIARLGALEAILIMTLEPILNPVWVAFGLGELPGLWACVGGGVVLAAVTLRGVAQVRPQATKSPGKTG
ncbi:Threonine/homoserine efflux transporter RhtA [Humidesulfovibrio mexicanus]|uniref:Threonine/homoserine efflux transporter RhtA n=2 Tax=Humidesulfovibrio mexicanus TaxID=147047 RepID=A0A239BQL7_9BACT|nr:DMT family transporter [Humidesulfovibrio mexicanus]SNS09952.1 Threonine/homoserine efflux transporter RhtA [Humidesulfovibrio mexicanus]